MLFKKEPTEDFGFTTEQGVRDSEQNKEREMRKKNQYFNSNELKNAKQ